MSCKVSIIVPVYNVEKYLDRCLNSLINQTLKDIEIIIVDDGSTDNCPEIIEKFAKTDSRIKIIRQKNSKIGAARNNGMKLAAGEYIGFVDSDDYIDENFYEELYNTAKTYNADIVSANILKHKDKYNKYNVKYRTKKCTNKIQKKIKLCSDKTNRFFSCWNKIYKKEFLNKYNLIFTVNRVHEDVIFSTRALYYSNILAVTPNTTYHYIQNPNSVCNTNKCKNAKNIDRIYSYKKMQIFAKENNFNLPERMNYYKSLWISPTIKAYIGYYKTSEKLFGIIPIPKSIAKLVKIIYSKRTSIYKNSFILFGFKFCYAPKKTQDKLHDTPYLKYKEKNADITTLPKAEGQIRNIQLANLELLKELDYVCKQNNLTYWLDGGTMLGAVRHKGFIPWDDDIDTAMPREDYKKIKQAFESTNRNPELFIDYFYNPRNTKLQSFLKVQHKNNPHLFVDIFPFDNYGKTLTKEEQLIETKRITTLRNKLLKHYTPVPLSDFELAKRFSKLKDKILISPPEGDQCDFVWGIEFNHVWKNWFTAYNVVYPLKTIEFEGYSFSCINNPDAYLTRLYGKYMDYPPKIGFGHSAYLELTEEEQNAISSLISGEYNNEKL